MSNLKTTTLTVIALLICFANLNAQETAKLKNKGKITTAGKPGSIIIIAAGGGLSSPNSDGKNNAFLTRSTTWALDASIPVTKRGWGPNGNWLGIAFGGTYNLGGHGSPTAVLPSPYVITGQTSSNVTYKTVDPKSPGFRIGAGPQLNLHFGNHFTVSPMILGEYYSMTQKTWSQVQTTQYNGQSYDFNLVTMPETKTTGFAVTPKLRLHYKISSAIGIFAEGSYTSGPKIKTQLTKLVPNGNPSPQSGSYSLQQLQTGAYVKSEVKSTAYSAMNFGAGITFSFGRKGWNGKMDGTPTAAKPPKTKSNSTNERRASGDSSYIRKGWDGTAKSKKNSTGNGTITQRVRWGHHGCDMPCCPDGLFCAKKLKTVDANEPMELDATKGDVEIKLIDDEILIKTVCNSGQLSKELLDKFISKKVQLFDNTLPQDIAQELFEKIGLKLPNEKILLKAENQNYQVIDGMEKGAKVIETEETATINIEGKAYNLKVITASGIADNSNGRSYVTNCCGPLVNLAVSWIDPATGTSTALPVPSSSLGTISTASMGTGLVFNSCINCDPYVGCGGTIRYKVWNYTTSSYSFMSPTVGTLCTSFTIPAATAFPTAGTYLIEVEGKCGGMKCKKATYQITTTGCCSGGSWGVKQVKYYTTRPYVPIPSTILTAEGAALYFDINFTCGTAACAAILDYEFYDNTSTLISSASHPSGILMPGIIVPHGAILLKVKAKCAGQVCATLMYKIQTEPCCAGSNWTRQDIAQTASSYTIYPPFVTGSTYDATPIICASTFPNTNPVDFTFARGSYYDFTFDHTSPSACTPCIVTYQTFDVSMVGMFNGTGFCGVPYNLRMPTIAGVYYLRITIMNGSKFCNSRTFKIKCI